MAKNIIILSYSDEAKASAAFDQIKAANGKDYFLKQMALMANESSSDERAIQMKEIKDFDTKDQLFRDGLVGAIAGILLGPVGILFGWVVGDLVGAGKNEEEKKKSETIFDDLSQELLKTKYAVVVYADELDPAGLDHMVADQGNITRFDHGVVAADIEELKKEGNDKK